IIICHLGNGSSLSACVDGKCVDTSMGITPLDGLVMGTRCGTLDPAVVEFICNRKNMTPTEVLTMMNKKSGLLGLAGDSDMRNVCARYDAGEENAILAIEMWGYVLRKYIGSFIAAMGGVDAIIFTAGIGENDAAGRERAVEGLEFMGIKIDHEKNAKVRGEERVISAPDSKVKVLLIPTNEELMIAMDTANLVG
ncbi:MAG: acetate kinase, partial [Oscillospiraceae bacterium]|nr:acetate kinase [Oscillospiraceae bacterium]